MNQIKDIMEKKNSMRKIMSGIGKRVLGSRGMILTAVCMAFPGVLLTLMMTSVMSQASENILLQIQYIAVGMVYMLIIYRVDSFFYVWCKNGK